jgi:hypothetical protein
MVQIIETNERKYPVRFGFNALREFSQMTGMTLNELENFGNDMTLDHAITLMYCGFKDGARKEKVKFRYDVSDIADWIDDDDLLIEKVFAVFEAQFSSSLAEKKN